MTQEQQRQTCERIIAKIKQVVPHTGKLFDPLVGSPLKWMYNGELVDNMAVSICIDAYHEIVDAWVINKTDGNITKHTTLESLLDCLKALYRSHIN